MSTVITVGHNGKAFVARCGNKQKTTKAVLGKSAAWNFGNATGELALKLGLSWDDGIVHNTLRGRQRFVWPS